MTPSSLIFFAKALRTKTGEDVASYRVGDEASDWKLRWTEPTPTYK
jgi:hypothetical protein